MLGSAFSRWRIRMWKQRHVRRIRLLPHNNATLADSPQVDMLLDKASVASTATHDVSNSAASLSPPPASARNVVVGGITLRVPELPLKLEDFASTSIATMSDDDMMTLMSSASASARSSSAPISSSSTARSAAVVASSMMMNGSRNGNFLLQQPPPPGIFVFPPLYPLFAANGRRHINAFTVHPYSDDATVADNSATTEHSSCATR